MDLAAPGAAAGARGGRRVRAPASVRAHDAAGRAGRGKGWPTWFDRDFRPAAADQLRVGDITYIHTFSGFAYLATVIDLFSNKVVGWMVADHMRTGLVLDALDMALAARRPGIGEAVMHTDRGSPVHLACFPGPVPGERGDSLGRPHRDLLRQCGSGII